MALPNLLRNVSKTSICPLHKVTGSTLKSSSFLASRLLHNSVDLQQSLVPQQSNGVLDALKGYKGHLVYYKNARGFSTSTPALSSHDHTKLWTAERALSASLLPLFPAALLYPCQALDCALAIILVMHNHWGVEANVVDYIRPKMFGPIIPKVAIFGLYGISIATLAGLFYFIFNLMMSVLQVSSGCFGDLKNIM
uniref:Succinate dehydrogenase [ubiquinone] cytochrome b small subunit n=1 Tax=Timema monikensis TaxID=170555 RepID=A0A7R9EIR2_9NEOP|nr:unnamed protein product [Timema monikensis]